MKGSFCKMRTRNERKEKSDVLLKTHWLYLTSGLKMWSVSLLDSIVARRERIPTPPPFHFLSRTKQLPFRRNHLKDKQFHCKHPGVQQFNMTLVEMTSVNFYLCCSVPPSAFYIFVSGTILLTAYWVQYSISVATFIIDVLLLTKVLCKGVYITVSSCLLSPYI